MTLASWEARVQEPPGTRELLILGSLVLGTGVLRVLQIDLSLGTDEVFSLQLARQPLDLLLEGALRDRTHPPLHLLLLHGWMGLFGFSATSARSLSVLCSLIFTLSGYAFVRRLASPGLAAVVMLFVAASPLFSYYGQEARPYALIAALSATNALLFVRAMDRPERRARWLLWTLCSVLLMYTQYLGAVLLGIEALVALLCLRRRAVLPVGLAAFAVLSVLPWLWAAMGAHLMRGADPLDLVSWMALPDAHELAWYFGVAFGENPLLRTRWLLLLVLPTLLAGSVLLLRRRELPAARVLLLLVALGAPCVLFVVALAAREPIFAPRQLIFPSFCFVAAFVLAAQALPRALGWSVLAVVFVCTASAFPGSLPSRRYPPWSDIAAWLRDAYPGMPVRSMEPWITDPLSFYRPDEAVLGTTATGIRREGESSLFLCRPLRCDLQEFGTGFELRKTWNAGWREEAEIRLYERLNTKRE